MRDGRRHPRKLATRPERSREENESGCIEQAPRQQVHQGRADEAHRECRRQARCERLRPEAAQPTETRRETDAAIASTRHPVEVVDARPMAAVHEAASSSPIESVTARSPSVRTSASAANPTTKSGSIWRRRGRRIDPAPCLRSAVHQGDPWNHREHEEVAHELGQRGRVEHIRRAVVLGIEEPRAGDLCGVVDRRPEEEAGEPRIAAEQGAAR